MRLVCLVATVALLVLCTPAVVIAGSDVWPRAALPLHITQGPGQDAAPVVAVNADGRVYLAWKHLSADRDTAQIYLSQSPDWRASSFATLPATLFDQVSLSLVADVQAHLFWSQPATFTQAFYQASADAEPASPSWELPDYKPSRFLADDRQRLHAVWVQDSAVNYRVSTQDITLTLPISPDLSIQQVTFALGPDGNPYLAWSGQGPLGETRGITYASFVSTTYPVWVAAEGHDPQLKIGSSGLAHLFWLGEQGLYYANSQDWSTLRLVVPGLSRPPGQVQNLYALAVGPHDIVHLVWFQGQDLWYANSADWECSKRQIATVAGVTSGIDLAVDGRGGLHVAWAVPAAEDAGQLTGNEGVYYLSLTQADFQLGVLYPQGGEVLTDDTLVQAEANLAAGDLLRVEFYLQSESLLHPLSENEDVYLSLGFDRDGRDGWSVPLHMDALDDTMRYRVMALGTDIHGRMAKALGDWFTIQPSREPWVWVKPPENDASGENASVAALLGDQVAALEHLDLYLAPIKGSQEEDPRSVLGMRTSLEDLWPQSVYVGSYELPADQREFALHWQQMPYDSRLLPDGSYRALAVVTDRSGQRGYDLSSPFNLTNTSFPSLEVFLPGGGAVVAKELRVSARANSPDGSIRRVDFYIERRQKLLVSRYQGQDYTLGRPDLIWLGSDADEMDGWSISVPVSEAMDGDEWYVRAIAFDDHGLSTSVRSAGSFTIVGRNRPVLRLLSPLPGNILHGVITVELSADIGAQYLAEAEVYVESLDGALAYLGQMSRSAPHWVYAWDTRSFPDGNYSLLIVSRHLDGHKSLLRQSGFALRNDGPLYQFAQPAAGEVLSGWVKIHIQSTAPISPAPGIEVYYRDRAGQLYSLGAGAFQDKDWCVVWNTTQALDGPYDLVALISDPAGSAFYLSKRIVVRDDSPAISWVQSWKDTRVRGTKQISWYADHPNGRPLSVTLEYSPDAGAHWSQVAADISATQSLMWNSALYPDSAHALLRLTASDGVHRKQTTSDPFTVDNVREAPQVTLLTPQSGHSYSGPVRIAWKAQGADSDSLTLNLDYRRGSGVWTSIAQHLTNSSDYVWDTEYLPSGTDYEVRLTANDTASTTTSVVAQSITLSPDHTPMVHLLWPNDGVRLQKEVIILWQATSDDKSDLLVDLYYSDNAGQTWLPLAEGISNTGYYVWQVSYLPIGTQYRVRVVARDGSFQASDESDGLLAVGANTQPQVALVSPIGGSSVSGIQVVSWASCDPDKSPLRASLMIRRSGQSAWTPLIENVPDDGFQLWDTTAFPDGDYSLQVVITDGQAIASTILPVPVSVANHSDDAPRVLLLSPRGGEAWSGTREITWQAWDRDDQVITATLSISADGGQNWGDLAVVDAHTGRYVWDTRLAPPGTDYLLRIVVNDDRMTAQDTSAGMFRLANRQGHPPHIAFISPDATGRLVRGNVVSWIAEDSDGDPLTVSLALSEDDGQTWSKLADDLLSVGEYTLDSSQLNLEIGYRLRLLASDGLYRVEAVSAPFDPGQVNALAGDRAPGLGIDAPSEGAQWSGTHDIRWHVEDFTDREPRFNLDLSSDGGQSWSNLAAGLQRVTSYTWDTTVVVNGFYLLKVTADDGKIRISQVSGPVQISNPRQNAPAISLIYPRRGDIWSGAMEVKWRASDSDGDSLAINIEYSQDLGLTWQTIAGNLANTGTYIWDTATVPNCDRIWLRATASDGRFTARAMSVGAFGVYNPHGLLVTFLAPRGGERWAGSQRITWRTVQGGDHLIVVRLDYSLDLGQTWRPLATDLPAEGYYLWDTRWVSEGNPVWLRVVASDGLQTAIDYISRPVLVRGNPNTSALPFYLP